MLDFREIDHPTEFLYQHETTGEIYRLAGFDEDIPILQPVNLILRDTTPLLVAPTPALQLPQHVQSRPRPVPVNGYHSGITEESVVEGEVISEEIIPATPAIAETIKRMPIEGKLLLLPAIIILTFFALAVPAVPRIVKSIQQASSPASVTTGKATDRLQRISQLDQGQYDTRQGDYAPSACSAASLTEIFNSYGASYKISTILGYEISIGAITASDGLVDISGISKTASRFGFDVQAISGLDQAISTANNGTPVIADIMPGTAWPGGHFLVVKSGSDSEVTLVDSWSTNFQTISRSRFLGWGIGNFQAISSSRYSVLQGHPTISADQINKVLDAYHSPARGKGQALYDMGVTYGIDPAYAVATFIHESSAGTTGVAVQSLSIGNLRCADWLTWSRCQKNFAFFSSWEDGIRAFYMLISGSHYSGAGNNTPETIIPLYAPQKDNNDEASYISSLEEGIAALRAGKTQF